MVRVLLVVFSLAHAASSTEPYVLAGPTTDDLKGAFEEFLEATGRHYYHATAKEMRFQLWSEKALKANTLQSSPPQWGLTAEETEAFGLPPAKLHQAVPVESMMATDIKWSYYGNVTKAIAVGSVHLLTQGHGCKAQTVGVGNYDSPETCAWAAEQDSRCHGYIMFSHDYPVWGCRCCSNGAHGPANHFWATYSYNRLHTVHGYRCASVTQDLGYYSSLQNCMLAAEADPKCHGYFESDSGYHGWAPCRCCKSWHQSRSPSQSMYSYVNKNTLYASAATLTEDSSNKVTKIVWCAVLCLSAGAAVIAWMARGRGQAQRDYIKLGEC